MTAGEPTPQASIPPPRRRCRRVCRAGLLALLVLLGVTGWAAWTFWLSQPPPPDWSAEYDLTAVPAEQVAPGTVVGDTPPAGWSHLIIKTHPRVREADRAQLHPLVVRYAGWMCTVFVADVRPEEGTHPTRYRFHAAGLGLGTNINGQDVVITPETAAQYGVELNIITRPMLEKGYAAQALARVLLRGRTMGLVDTPVWFQIDGRNRPVRFRYAMLVDAPTGRLDVVCWRLDAADVVGGDGEAVLLNPNTVDPVELVPDLEDFVSAMGLGKVPKGEASFGVDSLPPGRAHFTLPPDLRKLAGQTRYTADEAHALETGLRQLIAGK